MHDILISERDQGGSACRVGKLDAKPVAARLFCDRDDKKYLLDAANWRNLFCPELNWRGVAWRPEIPCVRGIHKNSANSVDRRLADEAMDARLPVVLCEKSPFRFTIQQIGAMNA